MLWGRPFRSSRKVSIGARCFSTCHAVVAPDFWICSAVMRNVPGAAAASAVRWVAGPQPARATVSDSRRAFMEASRFGNDSTPVPTIVTPGPGSVKPTTAQALAACQWDVRAVSEITRRAWDPLATSSNPRYVTRRSPRLSRRRVCSFVLPSGDTRVSSSYTTSATSPAALPRRRDSRLGGHLCAISRPSTHRVFEPSAWGPWPRCC